ncbi:MAG: OmpA family protein [Polyangiaceae bacterium]|nr:OmpA family protein [Polyangiaceae bacterium]
MKNIATRCGLDSGVGRVAGFVSMVALLSSVMLPACSTTSAMRGKIRGLADIADQAERNGAVTCAPRELAMAKSHLRFALIELDHGFVSKAAKHLGIAEPNANAAFAMSPPELCTDRGFVVEEVEEVDPDTDGDGIPDSLDMCVLEPEDKDGYLDEDGCPDLDNDGDGIPDSIDKCPNEPEDFDGFEDEDGCPDPDNDGDGVLDVDDMCPMEPGPPGGDRPGCPIKPSLAIVTDTEIRIMQQIHFDTNKAVIKPESYPVVDAVADIMKQYPKLRIEVQGHTDNRGNKNLNKDLSKRRAAAVMKALVERGIDPTRLRSQGYGQDQPIVANDSDYNRALNRRVQFVRTESEGN